MPRPPKKAKTKGPRPGADQPNGAPADDVATAVAEPPVEQQRPPHPPEERAEEEPTPGRTAPEREKGDRDEKEKPGKDRVAASLNIAKLQSMSMTELNQMARELSVENFGTMRKHEVIFHILQKNAERAGVLFSEGVLEVLPEGFGFLRSQSFNYLPCPEDIYVSPSQIRRFDLQTGNLIAGQIRPRNSSRVTISPCFSSSVCRIFSGCSCSLTLTPDFRSSALCRSSSKTPKCRRSVLETDAGMLLDQAEGLWGRV